METQFNAAKKMLAEQKAKMNGLLEETKAIQAEVRNTGATPQHESRLREIAATLTEGFKKLNIADILKIIVVSFMLASCHKESTTPSTVSSSSTIDSLRVVVTTNCALTGLIAISTHTQYWNYSYTINGTQVFKYQFPVTDTKNYFQFAATMNYSYDSATMYLYVNGVLKGKNYNGNYATNF